MHTMRIFTQLRVVVVVSITSLKYCLLLPLYIPSVYTYKFLLSAMVYQ